MSARRWPWLIVAGAVAVTGCGPATYPVEGRIVWDDGTPAAELAKGMVEARPAGGGLVARGDVQDGGTFRLSSPPHRGVFPGTYQLLIVPPYFDLSMKGGSSQLDPRYERYDTSDLRLVVKPEENKVELRVDRRKGRGRN